MILDTSAIIAILRREPGSEHIAQAIESDTSRTVSAASYLEVAIVIDGSRDPIASRRLDEFLHAADIAIAPVTERQVRLAREAYRDFGKGSGHPAALNFGDCFSYALAKDFRQPLLFKGSDFSKTDVDVVPT